MITKPTIYTTLSDFSDAEDGEVLFSGLALHTSDFSKEKEITDFIVGNITRFTEEILNDKLVSFSTEMPIRKRMKLAPRGRRIDLFISGKKKNYIIELKNAKSGPANRVGIGQLLDYGREFPDPKKEMLLITTKFDINTARTIDYYELPIRYLFITKSQIFEYRGEK